MSSIVRGWWEKSLRMASMHGCTQLRVSHEPQTRKEAEWEARAGRASGVNRDSSVWRQSGGRRPLHWASHGDAHIYPGLESGRRSPEGQHQAWVPLSQQGAVICRSKLMNHFYFLFSSAWKKKKTFRKCYLFLCQWICSSCLILRYLLKAIFFKTLKWNATLSYVQKNGRKFCSHSWVI